MIERLFVFFVAFFGMLSVFGIVLGYLHLIYAHVCFLVIVFCVVVSYFVVNGMKEVKIRYSRQLALILLVLLALDVYVSLPYLIYPHSYVDFGLNVAQGRLVTQMHGFPSFVHVYPNIYYGVFAIFNSIVLHAYSVSSIIAIIMQIMTAFAVFLIGKVMFTEKVGLIASFVYGFSFINIILLEQGYLTQNFATFFFASSMYLVIMCSKNRVYAVPLVLSLVGLVSYPHYFAIMFFAILVYFRALLKYLLVALFLLSPEIAGMFVYYATHAKVLADAFVMHGGIIVPNLFVLSVFLFAFFGFRGAVGKKKSWAIVRFVYVLGGVMGVFLVLFLINKYVYTWRVPDTRQLYIVVKLLYLSLMPVSVLAALYIRKCINRHSKIVVTFMVLYFAFFVNYSLVLNQKNNLPSEVYFSSEFLSQFYQNSSVGFDKTMLQHTWKQPRIYKSLYGQEDNYTVFSIWELDFLLQSNWAKKEGRDHYRSGYAADVRYTSEDVDYFVTTGNYLNGSVYYSVGRLKVYDLS